MWFTFAVNAQPCSVCFHKQGWIPTPKPCLRRESKRFRRDLKMQCRIFYIKVSKSDDAFVLYLVAYCVLTLSQMISSVFKARLICNFINGAFNSVACRREWGNDDAIKRELNFVTASVNISAWVASDIFSSQDVNLNADHQSHTLHFELLLPPFPPPSWIFF